MKIDFNRIDKKSFSITEKQCGPLGALLLVTPTKKKHQWEDGELHLRSLLCKSDGEIVCSGFPKFFNYSEREASDKLTIKAIQEGKVYFPEKLDGSLVVRTVIGGVVNIRTRGTHSVLYRDTTVDDDFKVFADKLNKTIAQYPKLLDPTIHADKSLLLEWTSPENKIIIEYPDSRLTVLGYMQLHEDQHPQFRGNPEIVKRLASDFDLYSVPFYSLPKDINAAVKQVESWKEIEGVVAWCQLSDGKMHLTKIKATLYHQLHSLRYWLPERKLRWWIWAAEIDSEQQFRAKLHKLGLDWEAVESVVPAFHDYIQHRQAVLEEFDKIEALVIEHTANLSERKFKALKLKEITNKKQFPVAMAYAIGDLDRVEQHKQCRILQISTPSYKHVAAEAQLLKDTLFTRQEDKEHEAD